MGEEMLHPVSGIFCLHPNLRNFYWTHL